MRYTAADGEEYVLNLIDTPGHVDFSYEVSRALQACEGAILVVDAAQGIEAQTLANAYLAADAGLEIIPVVNKIDLPAADPDRVAQEIEDVIGLDAADVLPVSAKEGKGIGALLERIVAVVPPPSGDADAPPRALVFDSWFDSYVGAVMLVRVVDGRIAGPADQDDGGRPRARDQTVNVLDRTRAASSSSRGRGGHGSRGDQDARRGADGGRSPTRASPRRAAARVPEREADGVAGSQSRPGVHRSQDALELQLNDSSLVYEPGTSNALGTASAAASSGSCTRRSCRAARSDTTST